MKRKFYLAYGMNTNLSSMAYRCPQAQSMGKVTLKNHKLAFKMYCDVVKQQDTDMECALWSITEDCEQSLDRLEGYPHFYKKKEVTVTHNNRNLRAMIYYMPDEFEMAAPGQGYLDTITQGYREHHMPVQQIIKALEELEQCTSSSATRQLVN